MRCIINALIFDITGLEVVPPQLLDLGQLLVLQECSVVLGCKDGAEQGEAR